MTEADRIVQAFRDAAPALDVLKPQRCTVLSPTFTTDGMFGQKRTLAVSAEDVQCRRRILSEREAQTVTRTVTGAVYTFLLPLDVQVSIKDVILFEGKHYEVISSPNQPYMLERKVMTGDGKDPNG